MPWIPACAGMTTQCHPREGADPRLPLHARHARARYGRAAWPARLKSGFPPEAALPTMTETLPGVSVTTRANVYFEGKCVSHNLQLADGSRKCVGVILPATLTFNTGAPEVMECVAGSCEYRLAGTDGWGRSSAEIGR